MLSALVERTNSSFSLNKNERQSLLFFLLLCSRSAIQVPLQAEGKNLQKSLKGDLLAKLPARLPSHHIHSPSAGDLVKPRGENCIRAQFLRITCKLDKNRLNHLLGQFW
jgi:hypothetical protein